MQDAKATAGMPTFSASAREARTSEPPAPFGSLLAGARARGVADGFEWLGLAAILINDRGEAMHVNPGAIALMGNLLYLDGGRLRARDPLADHSLAEAVRAALAEAAPRRFEIGTGNELAVHVAAMPADLNDPYQLLRAVILLRRAASRTGRRPL
jgi:hypothetical protein